MKKLTNNFFAYAFQVAAVMLLFGYGPLPAKEKRGINNTGISYTAMGLPAVVKGNTAQAEKPRHLAPYPLRLLYCIRSVYSVW